MMLDDEEDADDFLFHYQTALFEGMKTDNLFKKCASKRKCMFLAMSRANKNLSNETSCALLEDRLQDYAALVDDKNGVNNFAGPTLELLSEFKNVGKSFSSGLPDKPGLSDLNDLLIPLKGDCANKSENGCTAGLPTVEDIQTLFRPPEKIYESDTNEEEIQPIASTQPEVVGTKRIFKQSLYSSYIKNDPVDAGGPSSSQRDEDFGKPGKAKNSRGFEREPSMSSYGKQQNSRGRFFKKKDNREGEDEEKSGLSVFRTAKEQLKIDNIKKYGQGQPQQPVKKFLGGKSRVSNRFIPPMKSSSNEEQSYGAASQILQSEPEEELDERLRLIDPKMVELIRNEIMDCGASIGWDDIAGLHFAKATIQEIVVWPMLRPDIFTGLRRPPKGILLFGPPGTGKTLIGKCIASQSKSTFFSISASSLTSKWIGDGEKMVRALFAVARVEQPAVVFIDEIDSLLSQRSDSEHESSRRIKTEFLVQLDGAGTGEEDRILVIGATNRPQELDEAARRRLVKRLYIPLPDFEARKQLVENLMHNERNSLRADDIEEIAKLTDGFSGADMKNLCQEACLGPIRLIGANQMFHITADEVRPVSVDDFKVALKRVKSSVSPDDLKTYIAWDSQYGSGCGGLS